MKRVLFRNGYDVCRIVGALNELDHGAADHRIAYRENKDSGNDDIEADLS